MKKYFEKMKKKKLFWTLITIYIITGFALGTWCVSLTGQPSNADVYFDMIILAEYEVVGHDGDNYTHHVKISGYLTVKSEDGPLTSGRPIYGDNWRFGYVPEFIDEYSIDIMYLNFSLYSNSELDRSPSEISIPIFDLDSYEQGDVISLTKQNGFILADRSGIKQVRLEVGWQHTGWSHDSWDYSEPTDFNTITLDSYEQYQDYFHTRLSVVAFVVSAYFVAVPATVKTLRELYN